MGTKTVTKDPATGKVVMVTEEGNRETRFSQVLDCSQVNDWQQLYSTDVGEFIEGQLEISASIQKHASSEWAAIEVRIVGYIGSVPNVCAIWMLAGNKTTARLPLEQGDTYDKIAVEARPIVDGTPGPGANPPIQATLACALKLWS